jgi:hypothetical protein
MDKISKEDIESIIPSEESLLMKINYTLKEEIETVSLKMLDHIKNID